MIKLSSYFVFQFLAFIACAYSFVEKSPTDQKQAILTTFNQWENLQIQNGLYVKQSLCNPDAAGKRNYKGPATSIPEDLNISYTHMNQDNQLDALITFHPLQCDGGNANRNEQVVLLILSSASGYKVESNFMNKLSKQFSKGWFYIEKAIDNTLYGTYYEYKSDDPLCCPGIKKEITIEFPSAKVSFEN